MIFDIMDDGLTIKLSQEFIDELKSIAQKERELQTEAATYYESLNKRLTANHERLEQWEDKLNKEIKKQSQTRA